MTDHLDPGTDPGTPDDKTARMAVPTEADASPVADPVPAAPVTASATPATPTAPLTPATPTAPLTPASRPVAPTPVHENEVAWATPTPVVVTGSDATSFSWTEIGRAHV